MRGYFFERGSLAPLKWATFAMARLPVQAWWDTTSEVACPIVVGCGHWGCPILTGRGLERCLSNHGGTQSRVRLRESRAQNPFRKCWKGCESQCCQFCNFRVTTKGLPCGFGGFLAGFRKSAGFWFLGLLIWMSGNDLWGL